MPAPRQILPGRFFLITRRTANRQFFLRPDDETNNAMAYCLAVAAMRTGMVILMTLFESNHHHTVIYDPEGRCSEFMEHFHKLIGRSQNVLLGRRENLWSSEEPSVVELVDAADVIERIVYAAGNPVKDNLVEKVHHWPGLSGYSYLVNDRPLRATRPRHFFRSEGPMPKELSLTFTIPSELGDRDDVICQVRAGIAALEKTMAEKRRATGGRVFGRREIIEQAWRACPNSVEPRTTLRPRFAAKDSTSRTLVLLRYQAFLDAYRDARERWMKGFEAVFPAGTYWLRRFAGVSVEPLPNGN